MSNRQLLPAHARALRFAEHLRSIPLSQWDFATCLTTEFAQEFINQKGELPQHFCGSIGCAIGQLPLWAEGAADGWIINLPESEWFWENYRDHTGRLGLRRAFGFAPESVYVYHKNTTNAAALVGAAGLEAELADYFGLSEKQISSIFFTTGPYGVGFASVFPKMVADRLCKLVHACYEVEVGA